MRSVRNKIRYAPVGGLRSTTYSKNMADENLRRMCTGPVHDALSSTGHVWPLVYDCVHMDGAGSFYVVRGRMP